MAADLSVLPVKTASGLGFRLEIRSIELRPRRRDYGDLELALRIVFESEADASSVIDSTSLFVFSPTTGLDRRLDRAELAPEALGKLETALRFVSVHPYHPWGAFLIASAMFPNAEWFAHEARLLVVDTRPAGDYDDVSALTSGASPPATLRNLIEHRDALLQTVRAGDRSARLEMLDFATGDESKYHFACSVRITGPDEDRRLHAAHGRFSSPGDWLLDAPIQQNARDNLQRVLAEFLSHEPDDLVPPVLDALLRPSVPTWRDWVESGGLGALLQPGGFLARGDANDVTLTLRSPSQRVGSLDDRNDVTLDLELCVDADGQESVVTHSATLGAMLCDVPLPSTAFVDRLSVIKAVGKYRAKIEGLLRKAATTWRHDEQTWTKYLLRDDSLLGTLVSAQQAATASPPPTVDLSVSPGAIAKGDKVIHKAFGTGVVIAVERTGADARLKIEFAVGTKLLASKFVERLP
jgi:hypothetical protein